MDPLCVYKPSFIHFLVCANLLFGLLLFRNFLSHEDQVNSNNQPAWYPSSESVAISEHAKDQIWQGKVKGVLSQIRSSSVWGAVRGRGTKVTTFEEEEGLCDFKRDEGLPKQVLLQKLVECYKEIITRVPKRAEPEHENVKGTHNMSNRRLLREVTKKASIEHGMLKNSLNNAAPFHLDYSGPQTHPPKNN